MTKLFLKIHFIGRTIILLGFGIGAFLLLGNETPVLKILGYVLLVLMFVALYYDRKATNIEKAEKRYKEQLNKNTQKVSVKKYPFAGTKEGYVLKWAFYNENVAGSRYLNIPYRDLKVGSKLTLVKDKSNQYDQNAIKVLYGNIHLGFIHKNKIQEMFNKYSEDSSYSIEVRLNSVDEVNKKLQLEIGFYQQFSQDKFDINQLIKFVVVNTKNHQDDWNNVHVNDYVQVEFDESGYVYKNQKVLGELKKSDFEKLSNLSGDFRIIYKVGAISGSKEKRNLTGRIDAYIISNQ